MLHLCHYYAATNSILIELTLNLTQDIWTPNHWEVMYSQMHFINYIPNPVEQTCSLVLSPAPPFFACFLWWMDSFLYIGNDLHTNSDDLPLRIRATYIGIPVRDVLCCFIHHFDKSRLHSFNNRDTKSMRNTQELLGIMA